MKWAEIKAAPIQYTITISPDGTVRLSKSWNWGNMPMASEEAAREEAERDAAGHPFNITRKRIRF